MKKTLLPFLSALFLAATLLFPACKSKTAGSNNASADADRASTPGRLEFFETYPGIMVLDHLPEADGLQAFHRIVGDVGSGPIIGYALPEDTLAVGQAIRRLMESGECDWPVDLRFRWSQDPNDLFLESAEDIDPNLHYFGLIAVRTDENGQAAMDGSHITNAIVEESPHIDTPVISCTFDSEGTRLLSELSRMNIGRSIAIVLNDRVYCYPEIRDEIPGGAVQITGDFTTEEAEELARCLLSGTLPNPQ